MAVSMTLWAHAFVTFASCRLSRVRRTTDRFARKRELSLHFARCLAEDQYRRSPAMTLKRIVKPTILGATACLLVLLATSGGALARSWTTYGYQEGDPYSGRPPMHCETTYVKKYRLFGNKKSSSTTCVPAYYGRYHRRPHFGVYYSD